MWGIKSEHFFSWNSWLLLLTFMATYCFTCVRGNLQIQYFGRGDGWGVANKWKENSEYLCLHYHLLFTLFSQFMMLHLLQIPHTFWDNCKKNWTFVKGIFSNCHSNCSSLLPFKFCKLPGVNCQSERVQERSRLMKKNVSGRKNSEPVLRDKVYSIHFHMNNQSQLLTILAGWAQQ